MQSIDLDSRLTGKRRRTQKVLEYACRGALVITALVMIVFFTALAYRGIGAFSQTQIEINVTSCLKLFLVLRSGSSIKLYID